MVHTREDAVSEDEPAGIVAFSDIGVFVKVASEWRWFREGYRRLYKGLVVVCNCGT
jgi:hypothetical protein